MIAPRKMVPVDLCMFSAIRQFNRCTLPQASNIHLLRGSRKKFTPMTQTSPRERAMDKQTARQPCLSSGFSFRSVLVLIVNVGREFYL